MRLAIAQLNPTIGAIAKNVASIEVAIEQAKAAGANVVLIPEMAVSGYPPKDLLLMPDFVQQCLAINANLAALSTSELAIIWGNIDTNETGIGKALYNTGFIAVEGQIIGKAKKTHLPTYDVFDEARYFEPGKLEEAVARVTLFGEPFALTICEDLWGHPCLSDDEAAQITPVTYATQPLQTIQSADFILNLSASPYVLGKPALRNRLLKRIAYAESAHIIYVNQVGANDDIIFDGHSSVTLKNGQQWVASGFDAAVEIVDTSDLPAPKTQPTDVPAEVELISALVLGIRDYVYKTGFKTVYLGLSGGIDSALTAVLAQKALGKEHLVGVRMPGPYSSGHSLDDAEDLAHALGISLLTLPIEGVFEQYLALLNPAGRLMDLAEQNLQARIRGALLMALANRDNALLLTTGNKSELATGYSTLYGDSCGALAPLGDLYKTQVYALSHMVNTLAGEMIIPHSTLSKPPSAELAPGQTDQDSLPDYAVLDGILKAWLEGHESVGEICGFGYDEATVLDTVRRVMANEFKRQQMPPSLKVSAKAFGSGRVYPIVQQTRWSLASPPAGVS